MVTSKTSRLGRLEAALRRVVPVERVLTSGDAYESSRAIANGAITGRPAVIVRCLEPAEVQATVRAAREFDMPLSVRSGGHDWAGRALTDGGLTIDITGMRNVTVQPDDRTAVLEGGATCADVAMAAQPYGLVAVTGTSGTVGTVGLNLGGGYGPLCGRFGLALDNMVSADVVLPDGELVTADADRNAELFWALRGGGGNFGVVTALRIRLHPVPVLLSGIIMYPIAQAPEILAAAAEFVPAGGPDELNVQCGFVAGQDGSPVLFLAPTWSGNADEGASVLARIAALGKPLTAQVGPVALPDLLAAMDGRFVFGRHIDVRTRTVAALTPEARDVLYAGAQGITSPYSAIVLHCLRGAATRVPVGETAFGNRTAHVMVEMIAVWEPDDIPQRHQAWLTELSSLLAPHAMPGGYPNLLGPDAADQIEEAYGPNAARLVAAKRRFDPENRFVALPIPAHS
ncbi:FAD-binding oxidoreductase [Amycolatopsis pithecellobii]|uniref:FAD-binding protein n=1 Tax=Amycolatopsis pithecellobii TaxID=664692 RepID=A0A6N7YKW3_9PSEU|nr:FAD-binding oxidoreductase [Amycolatopsis pithecellobii]MTD52528.1 FAD-binding protein [Amycolatopsis pithecellobii]